MNRQEKKEAVKKATAKAQESIAKERVLDFLEVRNLEKDSNPSYSIIVCALTIGPKSRVKKIMPKHNLVLEVTVANPLNEYKANLAFTNGSRAKFFLFMENVWAKMAISGHYPSPSVPKVAWDSEKALYTGAKAVRNTTLADQHYVNLIYMAKQNGVYVANTCGNDLDVFMSSGYIPNKTVAGPSIKMGKVIIKGCKDTKKSGEAKTTVIEMPGCQLYEIKWKLRDGENQPENNGRSCIGIRQIFKGLPVGKWVLLYVRAVGPIDEGDWSLGMEWMPR